MADPISNRNTAQPPISAVATAKEWGMHTNYIVTLTVRGDSAAGNFSVSTSMDESFSISMASRWDAPFANVIEEAASKSDVANIAMQAGKAAGFAGRAKSTSAQVWQSSDPIELQIPFTFIAQKDPKTEVQDKVRNLLKLAAPSVTNAMVLEAPGPTMAAQAGLIKGRQIDLQIGNFIRLENCVVGRVDAQFDNIIGKSGIPHKAKVTVDISSYYTCFTTQDIDALFISK